MWWLLPFIALFLLLAPGSEAANNNAHARIDREWKAKKGKCEAEQCKHLKQPDLSENCVNECTSPKCFQEIYASDPLEDGEFDNVRGRLWTNCLRREIREQQAAARAATRNAGL